MIPDYKSDLGILSNRSSLITSSVGIVDWNGHSGGMSRDIVLFDKSPIDGTTGAPAVY